MTVRNLDKLLSPRSVAVVGASPRPGSLGAIAWRNLRGAGFGGPVFAVNPHHRTIDGVPVYGRLRELPQPPDLALLCTPPRSIAPLVAELGALGTRAAVVMTPGLDGVQRQAALDAARPHLLRLLGPNSLGLLSPRRALNASGAHVDALPGELAFVSQSGALLSAMLDWAHARGIGFSHLVALGERADVDVGDLLDHLASDGPTRGILLYLETVEAPRKFMSAARAAARNKPVIVVKGGRAGEGVPAAVSHTGALAGSDLVFDAATRRAGMLRVDTLQELFMAAQTLARFRDNRSQVLSILANGGGAGVMAADAAARAGVPLHELDPPLRDRLAEVLPTNRPQANPIDLLGDAPVERYRATLEALAGDPRAGAVLFLHAPSAAVASAEIARACLPAAREAKDRVMACWLGDAAVAEARQVFASGGIADYATPGDAVRAFSMLLTYRRNQEQLMEAPAASAGPRTPDVAAARALVAKVLGEGREWMDGAETGALLAAYGVPVARSASAPPDPQAAVAAARVLGHPVALKIRSPDILHKSDVGGVRLDLEDDAAVGEAARAMLERVARQRPGARVDGFELQQMARRPGAEELIVGASVDAVFGPVVLFGQGGVAVEVVEDRAIALPPLNEALARELVSRTRVSRLLAGYRDRPPARLDAVTDTLQAVSCMLADLPELAELDINPLLADDAGVLAIDARARVSRSRPCGTERFAIRPYPCEWVETFEWRGGPLTVRPIRPEDEPQHRAFVEALDPEDVRLRVFHVVRYLPRSELARLTQIDYDREMALIAERRDAEGRTETVGTVRAVADPDNVEAEFGIVLRSEHKGAGLGRLLMERIIRWARAQGLQRLVALVLRENEAMLALARRLGFVVDPSHEAERDVVALVLPLRS
jgi:acetyltransferase